MGNDTALCALEFGTNSVQLRERKNGPLAPKRHQMKHLDFFGFYCWNLAGVYCECSPETLRIPTKSFHP